jgi:hypothetical protein
VFKRIRWMTMGMGLGFTASVWVKHRLRRFLREHAPPEVASRAAAHARQEWRAALHEGRTAMREREAELRGNVNGRVSAPG